VTLSDVYIAGGEVLTGTLRWEKEDAVRRESALAHASLLKKERELSLAEAQVRTQIELLQRELELRRLENEALAEEMAREKAQRATAASEIGRLRGIDRSSRSDHEPGAP
jgi:circadian clock protein KaiC